MSYRFTAKTLIGSFFNVNVNSWTEDGVRKFTRSMPIDFQWSDVLDPWSTRDINIMSEVLTQSLTTDFQSLDDPYIRAGEQMPDFVIKIIE